MMKHSKTQKNRGFQITEVIMASSIVAVIVGVIVAIGISSTRGINRSADSLLCISLARHIMELTLSHSFDNIIDDSQIYSTYKDSDMGIQPGPLFNNFEKTKLIPMSIERNLDEGLFEQFRSLNIRYKVQVINFSETSDIQFKQILVSVFWNNGSQQLIYNLTGSISRRING